MSAPARGWIAWSIGRGFCECWHFESADRELWTLCGKEAPPGRVSRHRVGDGPTCKACIREMDKLATLKLVRTNG